MEAKKVKLKPGARWRAKAPLRVDFVGMSDARFAHGRCINACLNGLDAELYAKARTDDTVHIDAGEIGISNASLKDIYEMEIDAQTSYFFRALRLYPEYRLATGMDINIDCQYGSGGLSTSSSVSAVINALIEHLYGLPYDPMRMLQRVVETESHQYGLQDQLAVIFGGINEWVTEPVEFDFKALTALEFNPLGIKRYPIVLDSAMESTLAESLIIYESGATAGAATILHGVTKEYERHPIQMQQKLDSLRSYATTLRRILEQPCTDSVEVAARLGSVFNDIRVAHEALHPKVKNLRISDLFQAAMDAGATGARYTGAGGRGCILVASPSHRRAHIEAALNSVDTPNPGKKKTVRGQIQRFIGFDKLGARCWRVPS